MKSKYTMIAAVVLLAGCSESSSDSMDDMDMSSKSPETIGFLLKPTDQYVFSQVKTIFPKELEFAAQISATGKITYDTREVSVIAARISGRIEKLYVKHPYQIVEKGQKLMDIYSKELMTEQDNFIYLLKNDAENVALIKAAESRLLLQGFNPDQVNEIRKSKKSFSSVSIYSPYSGHLHESTDGGEVAVENMSVMKNTSTKEFAIKEGMYVQNGQSIFTIYNSHNVWAVLNIHEDEFSLIKEGQKVNLEIEGKAYTSDNLKIDFIEPVFRSGQNTVNVRVYINNLDHSIKIGSMVKATIDSGTSKGLFIPETAVVNLGSYDVIFVKKQQIFKAVKIQKGIQQHHQIEIISGVTSKEEIAENAQMLMDSESFIKTENE